MAVLSGAFPTVVENPFLSNVAQPLGIVEIRIPARLFPGVATSATTQEHTLPAGAIVKSATYTITAKPAGDVTIGSVAQVREGTGNDRVVDFKGMRTVSSLGAPAAITSIKPWVGTKFDTRSLVAGASGFQELTEIQAERLLVGLASAVSPDDLATDGSVTVVTPPADLELLVNGTRAFFAPGPAKPGGDPDDPEAFATTVDLTPAVVAAVAAAPADSVTVDVVVELRSSVPGQIALDAALSFQRTHVVTFPEGETRVVETSEEGRYDVPLPLPSDAAGWSIHEVQATVSAALPPLRVLPPDAPTPSDDARLVLDPDHAILVGLPSAVLARFATLSAIRIPVAVDADGAELAGTLRADAAGLPGDPLPQGQLGPVTLAPGDLEATPAWTTVPLAKEHELAPGERLWVGLQLARGRVSWPLAVPFPAATPPALPADAPLLRQLPNGAFRTLSSAGDVPTTAAAIRVAGEAPPNTPIEPLELDVEGTDVSLAFAPTADGVQLALRLDPPLTKSGTPSAFDSDGALRLRVTTKTPGSVSFGAVRIAYTDGGE
jgi:hypothetical protein